MKNKIFRYSVWMLTLILPLLGSCDSSEMPDAGSEAGLVEIRPVLPGTFRSIPRDASVAGLPASRAYDDNDITDGKLSKTIRLPEGSTVWLIAKNGDNNSLIKNSYVVYNSDDADGYSYLVPCEVNDEGEMTGMEGTPLYLKEGASYLFYAVSPARKLDEELFKQGKVGFQVKNGKYFYANDCRYSKTTPKTIKIEGTNKEAVQEIPLEPMINQTAELKFQITKGHGVHDLDIQPSGIQISGLQNDSPTAGIYGNSKGLFWQMSQAPEEEPIKLQHGDKVGTYHNYDYTIDKDGKVNIEVAVLPMYSISKPVIVLFRLKVNGVPSTFEMMLNEKDFKAGYSYGYRGTVAIEDGIEVITWQFVSWEYDVEFPFN